tara:strand:- start:21 stop:350 length:330 start_codon:yes stop_codon:yes gene_type:complete
MSHQLKGDGSSVISRSISQTQAYLRDGFAAGNILAQASPVVMDILDFANSNKAIVSRTLNGGVQTYGSAVSLESAMLTTGAAALTQIEFRNLGTNEYGAGSRFSIYGVR